MNKSPKENMSIGPYRGAVAPEYDSPPILSQLEDMDGLVSSEGTTVLAEGRNRIVKLDLRYEDTARTVVVKCFGRGGPLASWRGRRLGSKAKRTWLAASHLASCGVGTPMPVAFLDLVMGGRLVESYFISEYQSEIVSFKDELIRLFREEPECERFMDLMQRVADGVRSMHDSGFVHNDLGNQNILLRRAGEADWKDIQFIDLNRGAIVPELTTQQRARDVSRLYLPSDFLRVFLEMYYRAVPPGEFVRMEARSRRAYALHTGTRKYRHPIRSRGREQGKVGYPSKRDMWVWDERSAQSISTWKSRDRAKLIPVSDHLKVALATMKAAPGVWSKYKSLLGDCYNERVDMRNRVGVGVCFTADTCENRLVLLRDLGNLPVMVRFQHHETEVQWRFLAGVVKDLAAGGRMVSVALVQDRRAIRDAESWSRFVALVLQLVAEHVEWVEVGHAINRVKWGIWTLAEHGNLLRVAMDASKEYSNVRFIGPAGIDFEYPYVLAALENIPDGMRFEGLSHHLYVDRRGAPENRQGRFSSLEKFALARAIACQARNCGDKLIVSEVNWPISGTGVYSPVNSPYESPGPRYNDPSVSEDEYADFMVRYLLIALCSGMVDSVYWWRLVARGFGLVDDTDPSNWRQRVAYLMLKQFITVVGNSTFVEKPCADDGTDAEMFLFEDPDGKRVCVAYSIGGSNGVSFPREYSSVSGATGEAIEGPEAALLTSRPKYFFVDG